MTKKTSLEALCGLDYQGIPNNLNQLIKNNNDILCKNKDKICPYYNKTEIIKDGHKIDFYFCTYFAYKRGN